MKKNQLKLVAGIGLAQLALAATAVNAQDSTRALKDVVVTATRSPRKTSETGRVISVISAEQIKQAQGRTLPELLNNVPGLTFAGAQNVPGQSSDVFLRGAVAGNTLVLIDGFPANDASTIGGFYDLNAFPVDQIERVEVLKGAASTLYGSDAVAGVINIITKHPKQQGIKAAAQLVGGSYGAFRQAVDLNGMVGKTGIALNLSNSDFKGFSTATDPTGIGNFDKDGFTQRSVSANLSHQLSSKLTLNGNLQLTRNNGDNDYDAFTDDIDYTYKRTYLYAGLGAKWQMPKGNLVINLSQNNVWNTFNNQPADNFSTTSTAQNLGRVTNAEAVLNYGLTKFLDLTGGANFKYYNTIQHSTYQSPSYSAPPSDLYRSNNIASIFSSLFLKAGIFRMELSGRYNKHNQYGNNFTYTINPSLLLFDRLKVFGTVASAYKVPSLYQLYSEYGNPELKPEKTTASYEVGLDVEILKDHLSFNTALFKRKIQDVIYFYTDQTTFDSYYQNGSRQEDKGFEAELNLKLKDLTASAYMAYVTGVRDRGLTTELTNLYRRPRNTYGANFNYQVVKTFGFGLNYKWTGDRPDQDFSTFPASTITLKHYSLLDLHLQYQPLKQLNIFADMRNLLNETYVDWNGFNTRKYNFMAGVRYAFN